MALRRADYEHCLGQVLRVTARGETHMGRLVGLNENRMISMSPGMAEPAWRVALLDGTETTIDVWPERDVIVLDN